ncbi:MAG: LON peptidase substrate-binding domain-containing protein [Actinomycetes bacterium]
MASPGELIEGLPMFPLGTALLPGAMLPLHVFEARYRALVEHCLARDGEFGVVLIERGSEVGGGDRRFAVGTLARIVEASRFPDGRYALVATGVHRLRVEAWRDDTAFPSAVVEVLSEPDPGPEGERDRRRVTDALDRVLTAAVAAGIDVELAPTLPDDPVAAVWAAAARTPIGPLDAHRLLATDAFGARVEVLLAALDDLEVVLRHRLDDDGSLA